MKQKNYLKITLFISFILTTSITLAQSVMITTVVDGTLSTGECGAGSGTTNPRFVEFYVDGTINFNGYSMGFSTNGGSFVKKTLDGLGTITDSFIYVIADGDSDTFTSLYPNATFTTFSGTMNGNEALNITDGSDTVLDAFGLPSDVTSSTDFTMTWSYQDSYAKRNDLVAANATFSASDWTFGGNNALDGADCASLSTAVNAQSFALNTTTWTGGTSSDWTNTDNWNNGIPTIGYNVTIPDVATAPIIGTTAQAYANDLTIIEPDGIVISSGGSLIVAGTSSGNLTYNRTITIDPDVTKSWHLVSSPFNGEDMTGMIANNAFLTNGSSEVSFAPYDNSQAVSDDRWAYFGNTASDNLVNGKGYSTKVSSGDVSFTGTINTSNVNITLTQGGVSGNNFNLLGNPFSSTISSSAFISRNSNELVQNEIYVWNESTEQYLTKLSSANFKVSPGQGFFVEANSTNSVVFSKGLQSHETDDFQKTLNTRTEVKLNITDGSLTRFADIYYLESATTGFDNGYDGKLFGGVSHSLAIFSNLVDNSNTEKYQIQSLPNSDYENIVIPIGVISEANKEIAFSTEASNLPSGINVYLEDRIENTFTQLNEANSEYKITPTEKLNGIGRFYLHTKSSSLSTDRVDLNSIRIYKTNATSLRIAGLAQGNSTFKLFNLLGKEVLSTSFSTNGNKDITLPNLASGIYIVQLETESGKLNKKITLE
ncbi:T9SS type A sorting domain-containing protein [Polaribacter dokdonensis]|uniref:Glucose/sorbosone dehydrogenase n=1 Tax=Polaribacter dokdonensis DSW-5 TaxID=1300348 RepID=A0A0N0CEU4_9FLAO|nr:T9SS type A sorting domain-containing protein [Polaribacter dokdonensis]KOY50930.1 Glucose/sorbosone dehydrogenase [Polaribacter dokdonensis DSW-5]SEE22573.1 Por secretion system C-terminal sorting domain-containing protein [Polaribacter dokdonensis DSW-5]